MPPALARLSYWICLVLVAAAAFAVYVRGYTRPNQLFWDENYHIAAAQKYIDGVFFMEPHPPLGKLLIAAGEVLLDKNSALDTKPFLTVDHISGTPQFYSFAGVRLASTLAGWLLCIVGFLIFYELYPKPLLAAAFSLLLICDNALVVHLRSAMLEGPQLLFIFLCIYIFLRGRNTELRSWRNYLAIGLLFGLSLSIKANSAILLLLYVYLIWETAGKGGQLIKIAASFGAAAAVFIFCFGVHFALARKVLDNRTYEVSAEFKTVLEQDRKDPAAFVLFLHEAWKFAKRYEAGVPALRPDGPGENGSEPYLWPFGKRSISYRWDKTDNGKVKHLRLHCNPIGWGIGFVSVLLALILIGARRVYGLGLADLQRTNYPAVEMVCAMYVGAMAAMMMIPRVMYLYHYLIPLILSFMLAVLIFRHFFEEDVENRDSVVSCGLVLFAGAQVWSFAFFMPFTYAMPVSAEEFMNRYWIGLWRYELINW